MRFVLLIAALTGGSPRVSGRMRGREERMMGVPPWRVIHRNILRRSPRCWWSTRQERGGEKRGRIPAPDIYLSQNKTYSSVKIAIDVPAEKKKSEDRPPPFDVASNHSARRSCCIIAC